MQNNRPTSIKEARQHPAVLATRNRTMTDYFSSLCDVILAVNDGYVHNRQRGFGYAACYFSFNDIRPIYFGDQPGYIPTILYFKTIEHFNYFFSIPEFVSLYTNYILNQGIPAKDF